MSKTDMFYFIAALTAVLMIANSFLMRFIKGQQLQYVRLKDENLKATATITRLSPSSNGRFAHYEFPSATGTAVKGSLLLPHSGGFR